MAPMKRRAERSFALFDVVYEDGTRLSNRRVPTSVADSLEGEAAVRAEIEARDREIELASGRGRGPIKSVRRRPA